VIARIIISSSRTPRDGVVATGVVTDVVVTDVVAPIIVEVRAAHRGVIGLSALANNKNGDESNAET